MFSDRNRSRTDVKQEEMDAAADTLMFALRWVPYGGADSYEIFTTFGLTPMQFAGKLRRAAHSPDARDRANLSLGDYARLLEQADRIDAMGWPNESTGSPAHHQDAASVPAAQDGLRGGSGQ